ncbi:hypothetical protein SDC9_170981 [bioreactor metagenome]|uniref:Uncharacterized protein n=1 Tax=bioreactor metagenome TaxID=1076179 RepID=A0A645GCT4_9ZZZZ
MVTEHIEHLSQCFFPYRDLYRQTGIRDDGLSGYSGGERKGDGSDCLLIDVGTYLEDHFPSVTGYQHIVYGRQLLLEYRFNDTAADGFYIAQVHFIHDWPQLLSAYLDAEIYFSQQCSDSVWCKLTLSVP